MAKRQKIGLELEYPARDIDLLNWAPFGGLVADVSKPLLHRVPISISSSSGTRAISPDEEAVAAV